MKVGNVKNKVGSKIKRAKAKVAAKCGKTAKCAALLFGLSFVLFGCSTSDAPTAQRAQTITAEDISVVFNVAPSTNAVAATYNVTVEIATAAQSNETSGTETMNATATQTPTNDVKTDGKFTYGLASDTEAGASLVDSLASRVGLSAKTTATNEVAAATAAE